LCLLQFSYWLAVLSVLRFLRMAQLLAGWCYLRRRAALEIYYTSLKSLDLDSLQEIGNGRVIVISNVDLCYADNINWATLMPNSNQTFVRDNRHHADCGNCRFSCVAAALGRGGLVITCLSQAHDVSDRCNLNSRPWHCDDEAENLHVKISYAGFLLFSTSDIILGYRSTCDLLFIVY